MTKSDFRRFIKAVAALVLLSSIVAGCAHSGPSTASTTGGAASSGTAPSVSGTVPSEGQSVSEPAPSGSMPSEAASEGVPSEGAASEAAPGEIAYGSFIPFAVTIDNQRNARPQRGLDQAKIVIEALAEGGITRYFAMFDQDPGPIGPVRSARIYFNRLSHLWKLPLVHYGGNADALKDWQHYPKYNVDGIYTNGSAFFRGTKRKPPHNAYTHTDRVEVALHARGLSDVKLPALRLGPAPGDAPAKGVQVTYPNGYTASWAMGVNGLWQRSVNNKPDNAMDGIRIQANNVLVLVAPVVSDPDPYTEGSIDIKWDQPGDAWLLRDGKMTTGSWKFTQTGIQMKDDAGRPVGFAAGVTWIEVVPKADDVSLNGRVQGGGAGASEAAAGAAGGDGASE